jgi:hypothetical protein
VFLDVEEVFLPHAHPACRPHGPDHPWTANLESEAVV